MNPSDLQTRIQKLLDGEISAEEFAALEEELSRSPEARETYRLFTGLHSGLVRRGEVDAAVRSQPVVPIDRVMALQRRRVAQISLLAAAAVMVLTGIALWMTMAPETPSVLASLRAAPGSVFTLAHADGAKSATGTVLRPGSTVTLDHGVAEFDLPHRVRAVLEAPATMTLVDERTVQLRRGKGFFEVASTEGHGFTVETPYQRIVDLGTAFGIDLPVDSDQTRLQVFTGSVRIEDLGGEGSGEVIRAPMSVAIRGTQMVKEVDETTDHFRRQLPDRVETLFIEDFESGLLAETDYAVHMDPTAIRDLEGNRYAGIPADDPWRFSTSKELRIRNPGFEAARVENGIPVPHWQEVTGAEKGFNTHYQQPKPTEGTLSLTVTGGRVLVQDLDVPIRADTTYTLVLDVGNEPTLSNSRAIVSFFGRDAGYARPLAEIRVAPPRGEWLRNQTLSFEASPDDATGQTLGIALSSVDGRSTFDDLRIFENRAVDPARPPARRAAEIGENGQPDTKPPLLTTFVPELDASNMPHDELPTLVFDEPVRFGSGRIMIRNLTNDSETELVVGSRHTSLQGRSLTFLPPLELADGASQLGGIPGWESSGPVSRFNPSGDGHRYHHPDLADDSKARGILGSMAGPTLASLGTSGQTGSIRRSLGPVEEGRTYTVSVGIGCRGAEVMDSLPFAGYRIRLLCGSHELAGVSGLTPPGPPEGVTQVGFSWDSQEFPKDVAADTPLDLEISPLNASEEQAGYLDIDHVRVTALRGIKP